MFGVEIVKGFEKVVDYMVKFLRFFLVYLWNLFFCGFIFMEIKWDGIWYYMGFFIYWKLMVCLFFSILWWDGDEYFFVMFVEKVGIRVEDVLFVIVDIKIENEGLK